MNGNDASEVVSVRELGIHLFVILKKKGSWESRRAVALPQVQKDVKRHARRSNRKKSARCLLLVVSILTLRMTKKKARA